MFIKGVMRHILYSFILIFIGFAAGAKPVELKNSKIIVTGSIKSPVRETLVRVLQEETAKRSSVNWTQVKKWQETGDAVIAVALSTDKKLAGELVPKRDGASLPEQKAEGYRIFTESKEGRDIIWIIGADDRGAMFGAGKLLRTMEMNKNGVTLKESMDFATSPMQSVRGHQIGYRDKANSYDAWSVEQYEAYIRELMIFGTNAIETIPFGRTLASVHNTLAPEVMNIKISEICRDYGMDYWIWTPAEYDLKDTEKRSADLKQYEEFFKKVPRLNDIFFPGGDPGHNHPSDVLPFLKEVHSILMKYHPEAGIWISLQGFSAEQIDYFYNYLDENEPDWLRGIVSGPSSPSVSATRHRLAKKYKHRHYPDITHNVRCDYPVLNWDQAYALTIGREGINPQPNYYSKIHAKIAPFVDGFVSYSDGAHDDVNKFTFSMRGWDIETTPNEIMKDYARFFFGPGLSDEAAEGIFALEQNWVGPLVENGGVETTFRFWQNLEKENPQLADNWRWQMLVLRAYYDTYTRRRQLYEQSLEREANKILVQVSELGIETAMDEALEKIFEAETKRKDQDLHRKIVDYSDALFKSIGLQTDVEKYKAANSQRGCILQFVDYPLNNRWWLEDEFKKIREMKNEDEKLARLEIIRTWENPDQGCYYDNVSNIVTGKRVLTTIDDACDIAWWDGGNSRKRLSSQTYQNSPVLDYEDLDFNGRYRIRVSGRGDALLRVDGVRLEPVAYDKEIGGFKEFVVPKELTQDGKIRVTFDIPEESHIRWSRQSHISDVWVIKK